ncbi:hypothetical protein [Actinoplanes philippinensis]|uniref:hypothetical protein n=1 Tax=Actinoplanes philippinensis TaxID=35752 RepID=UPI0033C2018D
MQDLDARRIAGLLEAPGCHRRLVVDAASLNLPVLVDLLDCPRSRISPHATRRGQRFEHNVLDNAMAELVPLARTHLGMDITEVRQADLDKSQLRTQHPNLGKDAIRKMRLDETRHHVQAMLDNDRQALNLIRHPLIAFPVAGVTANLEPDVLAYASGRGRTLTPVEVKSFPLQHKTYADPNKVGAAARQVAVYIVALRQLVQECGADPDRVSDDTLLVLTSGFSIRPDASLVNIAEHVGHLERALNNYPRIGDILGDLPTLISLPAPPPPDASKSDKEDAKAQTKEAIAALPMRYGDGCASCPMLAFCTSEAQKTDAVAQLGTNAANTCGDVMTISATFDLIAGRRRPATGAERAVAHDFNRAAQALTLAGIPLEH